MIKLITAKTLDDALTALGKAVEENEERARKTLVFCEDRLTLLAEQAVLAARGGTFLTEITTFRRFLSRGGRRKTLSKQGSVLEISALLKEYEGELKCFRRSAAQAVYETIAQLSASCVDEGMLRMCAAETNGVLSRKLTDLAFLLEKYKEFLRERELLDENGYLALLPEKLAEEGVEDTDVIFFAFPSFTRQALGGVRAAMQHACNVTGIFLAGEEEFYTNEAKTLYLRVAEEFGGANHCSTACTLSGEALALHKTLFSALSLPHDAKQAYHVRIFPAQDETEEMNTVAALIRKYVGETDGSGRKKRYRDITVLVGGQEYMLPVLRAFDAYRIPYYADIKRPFSEHPFCTFVLSVLEAVSSGVLPDEADAIASSVYFGASDSYRNYLLRYGAYRGAAKRVIKEKDQLAGYDYNELLACHEKMVSILKLFRTEGRGSAYADGIRKLWELVEGERITEELKSALPEEERALLDIAPLEGVLRETEEVAGEEQFKAREFAVLLRSGFEALTVAILPQRADAVFVGDITDSRIRRSEILFCAGLTEDVPRVSQDTAVITDGEIKDLAELKTEIEPAIAVVNARAREALALNLCSVSEARYVSGPVRKSGKETAKSESLYYLERTLAPAPMPEIFPYDCSERAPAVLAWLKGKEALRETRDEKTASQLIERFSSVGEVLRHPDRADWLPADPEELLKGYEKHPIPEAGELYFRRDVSPTLLEEYFACPYRGFASRGLRLSEREERTLLDSADAGTFVHTVLERVAREFNSIEDELACRARAEAEAETLLKSNRFSALADTAAGKYTGGRLIGEAVSVSLAAYRQLKNSAYRVREAEAELAIADLKLKGKADRVDEADGYVRVIDYKTGSYDDSPVAYYTGRKLQLELYLLAASEGGMPAGAFYFPAADDFIREGDSKFRMTGFYCNDPDVASYMDTVRESVEDKSDHYEGGTRAEKGLSRDKFADFLNYAVLVTEGAEKEMRAGNIVPSPYEGTCKYCKLLGMCAFAGEPRKELSLKCGEIAEITRKTRGEEEV